MRSRYFILAPDGEPMPATREGWAEWADRTNVDPIAITEIEPGVWMITAFDGVAPNPYSTARIERADDNRNQGMILAEYRTREEATAGHAALVSGYKGNDDGA
jgi:hypothetical protein